MVATTWAVGVPLAAGILFLALAAPENPPLYLHWLLTAAGALAAGALGARYQSNFSDLLVWNWVARIHAERRLARGTRLLGFDELLHSDRPDWIGELRPRHDLKILTKLASALERKDLYTLGHSRRVARQSCRIAAELGLTEKALEELAEAAALHDVGKIRVPDGVLKKNGPLTIEELAAVQEHPEAGARLVSALGRIQLTAAVLHHHESWDGSGYPRGLTGEAIPLFARIIAVADTYDAMTSDRPYRRGMSHGRAMETVNEQSGRQFDPRVVAAFERCQQRHVVVPALIPLVLTGRRLLRSAVTAGTPAASPAAAAVAATAVVFGAGLMVAPASPIRPEPTRPLIAAHLGRAVEPPNFGTRRRGIIEGRDRPLGRSVKTRTRTRSSPGRELLSSSPPPVATSTPVAATGSAPTAETEPPPAPRPPAEPSPGPEPTPKEETTPVPEPPGPEDPPPPDRPAPEDDPPNDDDEDHDDHDHDHDEDEDGDEVEDDDDEEEDDVDD